MTLKCLRSEETRQSPGPSWSTPTCRPVGPEVRAVARLGPPVGGAGWSGALRGRGARVSISVAKGLPHPDSTDDNVRIMQFSVTGSFALGQPTPTPVSDVMTSEALRTHETAQLRRQPWENRQCRTGAGPPASHGRTTRRPARMRHVPRYLTVTKGGRRLLCPHDVAGTRLTGAPGRRRQLGRLRACGSLRDHLRGLIRPRLCGPPPAGGLS